MTPKPDQFQHPLERLNRYLHDKQDSDDDDDDENQGMPHDDVHGGGLGSLGGRGRGNLGSLGSLGGLGGRGSLGGLGGRGSLGGLGGRGNLGGLGSLGGMGGLGSLGGIGGRGAREGISRGGLGRGGHQDSSRRHQESMSDNVRKAVPDVPNESGKETLVEIAKNMTSIQMNVAAFINESQQKNVEVFKELLHLVHGLADKTIVHFKELSRRSAPDANPEQTVHVDDALEALISNIDKQIKNDTVYILSSESVDISELSKLFDQKNVQMVDNVRSLCDKIMSTSLPDIHDQA